MLHSRNRSRQPRRGRRNRGLHLEQSASLAVSELSLPFWREDSDEVAILRIVFPNARQRVYRAEWMLARDNDVAVRCKNQIERTQFGIRHQTRELRGVPRLKATMALSPWPSGPIPEARKSRPSWPKANPRGKGTTLGGNTCSRAASRLVEKATIGVNPYFETVFGSQSSHGQVRSGSA